MKREYSIMKKNKDKDESKWLIQDDTFIEKEVPPSTPEELKLEEEAMKRIREKGEYIKKRK